MKTVWLVMAACAMVGCSSPTAPTRQVTGTVRHFDIEGGFYAIRGDDGVTYDPTNLMDCYKGDGLRVAATVKILKDRVGVHMVGPIVEIQRISTNPPMICAVD